MLSTMLCSMILLRTDGLDAEQFSRIMAGALASYRDAAFVYEGDHRYVGPPGVLKGDPAEQVEQFQGVCAWRSDGALFLDIYSRLGNTTQALGRSTIAILGDRTEHLSRTADSPDAEVRVTERAVPGSFTMASSPLRVFFPWFFHNAKPERLFNFQDHGAEEVEGQKLHHVQIDRFPFATKDGVSTRHFWIDLDRGGHPVVIEERTGGRLSRRAQITLSEFDSDDHQHLWLPIRGVVESYNLDHTFYDEPILINTIQIVPGSVRLNQGLGDEVFRLDSQGGVTDTSNLAKAREEFLKPPPKPVLKTDFQSVQKRLDENLAKAEAQSKALDASASPELVDWTPWLQGSFALVGLLLLGGAAWWRWRGA